MNQKRKSLFLHKKTMYIWLGICVVGLAVLLISLFIDVFVFRKVRAGITDETEPVELKLCYAYQNPQWNAAIETIIERLESEYPNIRISYELNYEDYVYEDILTEKIARNELGDLVQLKTPAAYAQSGLLGKISDDVSSLVSYNYTYEGETCAVGMVESTWGILYNKAFFRDLNLEEPENYNDFLRICYELKKANIIPIGVGGADLWHMEFWTNHFFRADIIEKNPDWLQKCSAGQVFWTDEEPEQMLRHMKKLFQSDYVNSDWANTTDTELAYKMSEGQIAMLYTGPWTIQAVLQQNPDMELGWFYVPDSEGGSIAADNQDTFWAVTATCAGDEERYEAAMTFLTYFYSQEPYRELCERTLNFPATGDVSVEGENEAYREIREHFYGADKRIAEYIGNEDTPENFEAKMLEIVQNVLVGNSTVDEGLKQIQRAWDTCLQMGGAQ